MAVLSEIIADSNLTSKEPTAAVKERVRWIVYDASNGKVRIGIIKPPDRAEVAAGPE